MSVFAPGLAVARVDEIARVLAEAEDNVWVMLGPDGRERYLVLADALVRSETVTKDSPEEMSAYEEGWRDAIEEASDAIFGCSPPVRRKA